MIQAGNVNIRRRQAGAGASSTLTDEDARAILREVEGVSAAAPFVRGNAQAVNGGVNWATAINAVDLDFFVAREWDVADGRLFEPEEVRRGETVAILGRSAATALFAEENPIGATIRIRNVPVRVIGVMAGKGQSAFGQDQDDVIFVPLDMGRRRIIGRNYARDRSVAQILVKFESEERIAPASRRCARSCASATGFKADAEDDFTIRNLTEIANTATASARVLSALLAAVAGVSLLVGGIGIMNIMLVSVTERTREIGLRLAVGARPRDVLWQFLIEATTLSTLGGAIGVALGIGAALGIARFAGWPALVSLEAILIAVGVSGLIGVFFGFYPARRAAKLDPIEALRRE